MKQKTRYIKISCQIILDTNGYGIDVWEYGPGGELGELLNESSADGDFDGHVDLDKLARGLVDSIYNTMDKLKSGKQ